MRAALRFLALVLAVAGLYWLAGSAELLIAHPRRPRGSIWWPAGFAVAAVYLYGPRAAVGVLLGEWLAACVTNANPWWLGVMTAGGNGGEAVLGAWLLRRLGLDPRLTATGDVRALVLTCLACPVTMAALQTPAAALAGWFDGRDGWAVARTVTKWWASDAVGCLYAVPLMFALARPRGAAAEVGGRWGEALVLTVGTLTVTVLAFAARPGDWTAGLTAAAFPFLAWAGLRFGPMTTALMLAGHALVIIVLVARRLDPLATTGADCFPSLHLLLAVSAVSALLLAAAVQTRAAAERRSAEARRWEELGVLAGGIAHDLNNRLTVVMGYTELAAAALPPGAPTAEFLRTAARESERMVELARLLLAYTGRTAYASRVEPTDLGAAVREAAAGAGLSVAPAAGPLVAVADAELVRLAVRNLLTNAAEALAGGGGSVTVAVTAEPVPESEAGIGWPLPARPGAFVRVRVADDGGGMSAETVARMFDPFFSSKGPGRGLGLSAVLGAVRAAGGFLRATSAEGKGTTIDMYFPAAPDGA